MRTILLISGIALLGFGILFAKKMLLPKKKNLATGKNKSSFKASRPTKEEAIRHSAQDVLPLSDVIGADIIRPDGFIINIIEVECINTSLLVSREKDMLAYSIGRVLRTLNCKFSIILLHRQVDNTKYYDDLKTTISEIDKELKALPVYNQSESEKRNRNYLFTRRDILSSQLTDELERVKTSGLKLQKEVFVCLETKAGQDSTKRAREQSMMLLRRLDENGFHGKLITEIRAIDVLKAYFDEPMTPKINIDPYAQIPLMKKPSYKNTSIEKGKQGDEIIDIYSLREVYSA